MAAATATLFAAAQGPILRVALLRPCACMRPAGRTFYALASKHHARRQHLLQP